MQELIMQLFRLYLPAGAVTPEALAQHVDGQATHAFDLVEEGAVRAVVLPFDTSAERDGAGQWERLCDVANALQAELRLPAPAVSVSGIAGFRLWLSFEEPVPVADAQRFLDLLRAAYFADVELSAQGVQAPVELPPCLIASSGKWAAFIHPGMGASFAEEPGLDMAPPAAGQAAFLQGLQSISPAQLQRAFEALQPAASQDEVHVEARPVVQAVPPGLLLKDAKLEDIVRHLHGMHIEPTFRHLLPRQ